MGSFHIVPLLIPGFRAGADLSATTDRYTAVQLEADGDVIVTAAEDADFLGILQDTPASGAPAEIAGPGGGSKARAAGTIAPMQPLKTDASGHLVPVGPFENAKVVAFALESAVDNDVFSVMVVAPFWTTGQSVSSDAVTQQFTVTLAQVVAGLELLPAVTGKAIFVHDFTFTPNGSFAAGTAIVLEDSTTGTDFVSLAQAQLTDNAVLTKGETGVTVGAALGAGGAVGEGLTISQTGSDFTTATDILVSLHYSYV